MNPYSITFVGGPKDAQIGVIDGKTPHLLQYRDPGPPKAQYGLPGPIVTDDGSVYHIDGEVARWNKELSDLNMGLLSEEEAKAAHNRWVHPMHGHIA